MSRYRVLWPGLLVQDLDETAVKNNLDSTELHVESIRRHVQLGDLFAREWRGQKLVSVANSKTELR